MDTISPILCQWWKQQLFGCYVMRHSCKATCGLCVGCELPPECIESKYMTVRKVVFRIRFRSKRFKTSHWLSNIENESNIKKYTRVYFVIRETIFPENDA